MKGNVLCTDERTPWGRGRKGFHSRKNPFANILVKHFLLLLVSILWIWIVLMRSGTLKETEEKYILYNFTYANRTFTGGAVRTCQMTSHSLQRFKANSSRD